MIGKIFLSPLASIFNVLSTTRKIFYKYGIFPAHKLNVCVISVGNLTLGGTGKTPFVDFLSKQLQARGRTVGILSRGYKGQQDGEQLVDTSDKSLFAVANECGDEPTLLSWLNPKIPVVVGKDKVAAAKFILEHNSLNVLIADDAFQHLRLKRDIDIVILDATEPIKNYQLIPVGRARESFKALKRADFIMISKVNLSNQVLLNDIKQKIFDVRPDWKTGPARVFELKYMLRGFRSLNGIEYRGLDFFSQRKVLLVSGIGRPKQFRDLVESSSNCVVCGELSYPDHYSYSQMDMDKILRFFNESGAESICVTQKDAVKLSQWKDIRDVIWVTDLGVEPTLPLENLYDELDRVIN